MSVVVCLTYSNECCNLYVVPPGHVIDNSRITTKLSFLKESFKYCNYYIFT